MDKKKKRLRIRDKNYHGFVNNLDDDDKRLPKFLKQRKKYGFDATELWSLDHTIANFVYPRLKAFRKAHGGVPREFCELNASGKWINRKKSIKKWHDTLDKMVLAFELAAQDKVTYTKEEEDQMQEGLKLFAENFFNLWT